LNLVGRLPGIRELMNKMDSETSLDLEKKTVTVFPVSSVWLFSKTVRLSRFRYSATGKQGIRQLLKWEHLGQTSHPTPGSIGDSSFISPKPFD
jgi:hypothetical protein